MPVKPVKFGSAKRKNEAKGHSRSAPVTWPTASSAEVTLGSPKAVRQQVGGLPVSLTPLGKQARGTATPAKLKVSVASRSATAKAGIDGLLLSLSRTDTAQVRRDVEVEVDYSAFRGAFGGDWAARLHLVALPSCVLTTPTKPQCRTSKVLKTFNNTETKTLSASASTSAGQPLALAAVADAAGSSGSFKATPLQPSGTWSAGGSTGAFTYSYPIGVPAVPGGLQPSVSLAYSSQSVDGRTAASNNQTSWIGDGWSWSPGFIERRYKSCNDDMEGGTNSTKVGDQCWYNENATLSLGGKSTELVYDSSKGWHPAQDSGEKVEKLTGASNGDKGTAGVDGVGEHWKVTTLDGTQYFFGLNKLRGWSDHGAAADDPLTNSTLTAPVFGNQSGEPCYDASFAAASCQQAWRWQLDYVVDPRGNGMAYYWKTERNNYGLNVSETTGKATVTAYDRGSYLDHIEYGLRDDTVFTAKAMGRVDFATDERCLSSCGTFDEANAQNWPDTPVDLYCKDGSAECKDQFSPSFWSRKRLRTITTKVLTGGAYKDVDSWSLTQTFPPSGDGISTPMWLDSIQHTGKANGTESLPAVTFAGVQMANRVDKTGDGLAPFIRLRMYQVTNESGGTTQAVYSKPDCTAATLPASDATNKTRCYPVKWAFEGATAKEDWFNSYVVEEIVEDDNLLETPSTSTKYSYLDGAAWAKNTDEFTKKDDRTYSIARGYGRIQTRKGGTEKPPILTEERYFRGMDGATVKDSAGTEVTDREQFAGMTRESATYNDNDTAKLVAATSYTPWRSAKTASRTRTGLPDLEAYLTGTLKQESRTTTSTGVTKTSLTRTFDEYGQVTATSSTGDTAKTGDETCATTTYVGNSATRLLNTVAQKRTVAALCTDPPPGVDGLISDERTYYDGASALTTAPTKGQITKVEKINGAGTGYDTVSTTPVANFDIYGRALSTTDVFGETTTTRYTPTTGETPTQTLLTNPLGHQLTTDLDPLRGQALKVTDPNLRVTSTTYDALGRLKNVWLPTRSAITYPDSPNQTFDYQVRNNGPTVVTTKALNHNAVYQPSYTFYDGLMRQMETQEPSPDDKGRLVTETVYDSRGQAWRDSGVYYAEGQAEPVPVTGQELKYPASTETVYDGAGRPTVAIARKFGDETKRTTTTYTGDTTTVVPPKGGIATAAVVDALGRTTELKQFTDTARTKSQSTTYKYDTRGRLELVTDPSGAQWKYGYDAAGRQNHTEDPDKGASDIKYDKAGRATDVTDARPGITLHTDYDALGRPTALTQGATKRASWEYDKATKGVGQLYQTTRYDGSNAYVTTVVNYNAFYKPVVSRFTVPAAEKQLAGVYEWTDVYNPHSGQLMSTQHPAAADLPAEEVINTYAFKSSLPMSVSAGDGEDTILASVTYDHYGRPAQEEFGAFGQHLWKNNEYDEHTGALTRAFTDREVAPQRIDDIHYTYDPVGNVTRIGTTTGQDATAVNDTQCFSLDVLARVTEAWTSTNDCAAAPTTATVGGPDPYWTSYTYDAVGNRKTETQHAAAAGPATDTVRTYAPPKTGTHNLPSVTQTGTNPHLETYTYDEAGNTRTRKVGNDALQDLLWDPEGHLESVTQVTDTTSYVYGTGGERLIRRDSTGTTLYLPLGNELHLDKAGKATGTRYYTAAGETSAMRTGTKLTFLSADRHGTGTTQITSDTEQKVTRRKTTPFGAPRGTQSAAWLGDKGFVGGTADEDTELTHLGAREYDPTIGRFISVDPIMNLVDPQQLNGYTYGNNNPATHSDPTGLCPADLCGAGYPIGGTGQVPGDPTRFVEDDSAAKPRSELGNANGAADKDRDGKAARQQYRCDGMPAEMCERPVTWCQQNPVVCQIVANGPAFEKAAKKAWELEKAVLGISDIEDCFEGDGQACLSVGIDLATRSKWMEAAKNVPSCGQCFLAGTEVLLAGGKTKNIEDVKVGDKVFATDPDTGESANARVTRLIVTEDDKHFNKLSIVTSSGVEPLTATHEHPFWSPSEGRWVKAGELKPGVTVMTRSGETALIVANEPFVAHARTYNLTVERIHTYYVLAGQTPVLVHNSNCPGVGPGWFPYGSGKIPSGWSGPSMTSKFRKNANKEGFVWRAPKGQDSVRIDRGDPNSQWGTQQVDHVVINSGGRIVGRGGELLPPNARIQDYPAEAHVPLIEWQTWRSWNAP
ncbi:polymorphic toxin-type HINT domain-containing protein [[Kitasatospora] papulosa]|uniref:polymorphic toxin-type HINT domain-containing protein n=1 Tax=[Kitasatospora] papulosa TaxID=1464011 RepID=UPI0036978750